MHFLAFSFNISCKRLSYRGATHRCGGSVCAKLLELLSKYSSKLHLLSIQTDINRYRHCKICNVLQQGGQKAGACWPTCTKKKKKKSPCNVAVTGFGEGEAPCEGRSILQQRTRKLEKQVCYFSLLPFPSSAFFIFFPCPCPQQPQPFSPSQFIRSLAVVKGCGSCATIMPQLCVERGSVTFRWLGMTLLSLLVPSWPC